MKFIKLTVNNFRQYKGLNEIILFAQQFKNFKDIELYTNGTIPFNKLKFKDEKTIYDKQQLKGKEKWKDVK